MTVPLPLQRGQTLEVEITPNGVRCWELTWPRPLHSGQVWGAEPFAAPEPEHASQASTRIVSIVRLQPFAASSKEMVMLVELSLPRCGAFGFDRPVPKPPKPEPPKKLLKISPKSKSNPPAPPGPPAP